MQEQIDYQEFFNECEVINIRNEEHWHELRATGIGGSDVGIILNLSKWKTPYQLYQEKIGEIEHKFVTNESIEKGNRLEQPMIDLFKGLHPENEYINTKNVSLKSEKYGFMNANLDGAFISPDMVKTVLEIKTTTIQNMDMLKEWGYWDNDQKKWVDKVPILYFCQCLHYLIVTGFERCIVFAHIDFAWDRNAETRTVVINREDVLDDLDYIIREEQIFWKRVEDRNPPPFLSRTINI